METKQAITVNWPPAELYQFWHDFQNLPRFMQHLNSVKVTGYSDPMGGEGTAGGDGRMGRRDHRGPPGRLIAWHSAGGRDGG